MKIKNILLLSAISLTAFSAQSRLYVGAGAAYVNSMSIIKLTAREAALSGTVTMDDNSKKIAPRFFAGYEKDNNNCYWGLEAFGSFSDLHGQNGRDFVVADNGPGYQAILANPGVKYSRSYLLGARAKFGGYITDNLSVFGAFGVIGSEFKISYTDDGRTAPANFKKTVLGIEPGVGISYRINSKWRTGLEYFYQQYSTFSKTYTDTVNGYSATTKSKFRFSTFMASVSYVF
jgi:opacity protein-like surface antigen